MTTYYIIEARGPAGPSKVIEPFNGNVLRFPTHAMAAKHRDAVKPSTPSKYYPLVVVKVDE
jgi:hypothetical protein